MSDSLARLQHLITKDEQLLVDWCALLFLDPLHDVLYGGAGWHDICGITPLFGGDTNSNDRASVTPVAATVAKASLADELCSNPTARARWPRTGIASPAAFVAEATIAQYIHTFSPTLRTLFTGTGDATGATIRTKSLVAGLGFAFGTLFAFTFAAPPAAIGAKPPVANFLPSPLAARTLAWCTFLADKAAAFAETARASIFPRIALDALRVVLFEYGNAGSDGGIRYGRDAAIGEPTVVAVSASASIKHCFEEIDPSETTLAAPIPEVICEPDLEDVCNFFIGRGPSDWIVPSSEYWVSHRC